MIRDILHRLHDRFPRRVLVWPVRVQGETSAAEVATAIRGFNALPQGGKIPRPDLLIVARGGGSLEDLWSFNEEEVLRAAAESRIPLIAAVGHETDWTLLDLVADLRAPTPTGAAEKAVPVRAELLNDLADLARRHTDAIFRSVERRRNEMRALVRALPLGDALLATPRQRADRAGEKLRASLSAALGKRHLGLAQASRLLARHAPQAELSRATGRLNTLVFRLDFGAKETDRNAAGPMDRARQKLRRCFRRAIDAIAQSFEVTGGAPPRISQAIRSGDGRVSDSHSGKAGAFGPTPACGRWRWADAPPARKMGVIDKKF